jgi:hypothetical protein
MRFHNLLNDEKAKASALDLPDAIIGHSLVFRKQQRDLLGWDTDSVVTYLDSDPFPVYF